MGGFIDLHSHWVAGVDDGVRSAEAGVRLLALLHHAGFSTVVATPHMRAGMFDNDRATLIAAYERMAPWVSGANAMPQVHLACEHFLSDVTFERLRQGEGLPYPGGGAALIELAPEAFPPHLQRRFYDLCRAGVTPVLAHPERYAPVWKDDSCLDPLIDAGALCLLDLCSLVGKYGRAAQNSAEKLVDDGAYEAACSDAHKPEDVEDVVRALHVLERRAGKNEVTRLLRDGPRAILSLAGATMPKPSKPSTPSTPSMPSA